MEQKTVLDTVTPWIIRVARNGVPYGFANRREEPGYLLVDGTALLECERYENGFYIGGAGMDGMYLRTGTRYAPVQDEHGVITAFRRMTGCLSWFNGEGQNLIAQYTRDTREKLLHDLTAALPTLEHAPQTYALFAQTLKKLEQVPPCECERLMADLRAVYQARRSTSERNKSIHKRSVTR